MPSMFVTQKFLWVSNRLGRAHLLESYHSTKAKRVLEEDGSLLKVTQHKGCWVGTTP